MLRKKREVMTRGDAIRDLRIKMGMTQKMLADLLGITDTEICHYEKNKRRPRPPIALALTKLARKRGIKVGLEFIYED